MKNWKREKNTFRSINSFDQSSSLENLQTIAEHATPFGFNDPIGISCHYIGIGEGELKRNMCKSKNFTLKFIVNIVYVFSL